ncbi:hypothetical protein K6119_08230 [Paracrocinitomix mangrovi]|uniref:hypothetical protein n=1 Tax=Paracrocinitomix mangrovi TaxID=2862509 RepID=UPI001C8E94C0|nr:hypothetical protein [Paracrocinitomix mangrovi]UKN03500.1 hypothetical protein K6119_08230 [Paracrocinitomix mangrovi]
MKKASINDLDKVVNILTQSFMENPSVLNAVKPGKNIEKRVRELAIYAVKTGLLREGVYLSDDDTTAAVCYHYNIRKEGLKDYFNQIRLVAKSIGILRVPGMLKKEGYLKKIRPSHDNFLYFWFLGTSKEGIGKGGAQEIAKGIEQLSIEKQLPIYLETSVPKNKRVYERFGFETYHEWKGLDDKALYFMRKNVS